MEMRPAPIPAATPRLHALDNLRALMMWLGIVLHVASIHLVGPSVLAWRDEQRTFVADLLVGFIHAFRMPLFFILAGFFAALLIQSRGSAGMAWHRLRRLGLPFLLFWPPLFALVLVFALLFVHRMARGSWGLDHSLMPLTPEYQGPATIHLWFLWLLLWLSLLAALAAALRVRWPSWRGFEGAGAALRRLGTAWWGFSRYSRFRWLGQVGIIRAVCLRRAANFCRLLLNGCTTACFSSSGSRCSTDQASCSRCISGVGGSMPSPARHYSWPAAR